MTKRLPNLQVALDHSDLQGAIKAAVSVGHEVDVIEAGTVCLLQVGSELVEVLRSLFPDKIIVADTKMTAAMPIAKGFRSPGQIGMQVTVKWGRREGQGQRWAQSGVPGFGKPHAGQGGRQNRR